MGTITKPGDFDCYHNALPDEPMFVLLARDPDFHRLVWEWSERRMFDIGCGERPEADKFMVAEARYCAIAGAEWRKNNMGIWRKV